jgi:hypothetical protein
MTCGEDRLLCNNKNVTFSLIVISITVVTIMALSNDTEHYKSP